MLNDRPLFQFQGPWGVPVQVTGGILFLALFFLTVGAVHGRIFYDLIFVAILLGSILLHELGHAWAALIVGVPVRRIVLFGGGGLCEQARAASRDEAELIVAMGPIVNLVIWAVASLAAMRMPYNDLGWLLHTIAWVNGFLAVYNLIPMQPLDGGRLLHLALLRVVPAVTARQIAGAVGLAFAILWLPLMAASFLVTGVFLLIAPPVSLHWQMMTGQRAA